MTAAFAGPAVVTGGGSGIGFQTALTLSARGVPVAVVDRAERPADLPAEIQHVRADVSRPGDVAAAFAKIDDLLGPVAHLVCAAGVGATRSPTVDIDLRDWRLVMGVHLDGTLFACQEAARRMAPGSSIVTVGSIASAVGSPERVAYAAAKGAIRALTRSLAVEWAEQGIRVNCVAPGYTRTPLVEKGLATGVMKVDPGVHAALGRMATPDEIAEPIVFLLSSAASYVTGEIMVVDGGFLVLKTR